MLQWYYMRLRNPSYSICVNKYQHKGKILGQQEDLETSNLINIHNAAYYYKEPSTGRWIDYTLPEKKSDLGRPVIPIAIGAHIF